MTTNEFSIKNLMEDIVFLIMEEIIKDKDVCKCNRCRMDIAAIALSGLPPKYVVTREGEAYAKTDLLSRQFRTDVIIQLIAAMDIVTKNPHH